MSSKYLGEERRNLANYWHLDKKVSIGIIIAILVNSSSFIWYGAKLDAQVQTTKGDVAGLQAWREKQDDERSKINTTLATMSQKLSDQNDLIVRIDQLLEQRMFHDSKGTR